MKKQSIILIITALLTMGALWFSCQKKEPELLHLPHKGNVEFSLNADSLKNLPATKGTKAYSLDDANAIVLTIEHVDGNPTDFSLKEITLVKMNGGYFSQKIALEQGDYKLTGFLLVDDSLNTLFATPVQGSPQAVNVSNALPITFTVTKDTCTMIPVEVLSTWGLTAADFGLPWFNINEPETFSFFISVYEKGSYNLLQADITVNSGANYTFTQNLEAIVHNIVKIKDGYANYSLSVSKQGYLPYINTFTNTVLKAYTDAPLTIELEDTVSYPHFIGENFKGGIIFWLDSTGKHGLIAAPGDQHTGIQWQNYTGTITGATGTGIGHGATNTAIIVNTQGQGIYAAKICSDLVLNQYHDWFLPSKDELNLLYQQRGIIGGFAANKYWSSSEHTKQTSWCQDFSQGSQQPGSKNNNLRIRAVRAF